MCGLSLADTKAKATGKIAHRIGGQQQGECPEVNLVDTQPV
jgi:hypothetical protein